ncbi:hypothetical protein EV363DRAFT_1299923 [Boletus edulis]|nr:hypothetical protein EV363DRAFT_1299923 [Boletus edulis]
MCLTHALIVLLSPVKSNLDKWSTMGCFDTQHILLYHQKFEEALNNNMGRLDGDVPLIEGVGGVDDKPDDFVEDESEIGDGNKIDAELEVWVNAFSSDEEDAAKEIVASV